MELTCWMSCIAQTGGPYGGVIVTDALGKKGVDCSSDFERRRWMREPLVAKRLWMR